MINHSNDFAADPRPIGVFDSGVGGLTVLRSLMAAMPGESFIYLGDTARVPYGTKSADTVRFYAMELAQILLRKDVKMIVIACNTASVHAARAVAEFAAPVPVISMVAPAAAAAAAATRNNSILVMATQSTVRSGSYASALRALNPELDVQSVAAQILVALAEEGWVDGAVADGAIERYIGGVFADGQVNKPDTVILGCTHFPLLREAIMTVAGSETILIDSGQAAADYIAANFMTRQTATGAETLNFFVTDAVDRFKPMIGRFLGYPEAATLIDAIDLGGFVGAAEIKQKRI